MSIFCLFCCPLLLTEVGAGLAVAKHTLISATVLQFVHILLANWSASELAHRQPKYLLIRQRLAPYFWHTKSSCWELLVDRNKRKTTEHPPGWASVRRQHDAGKHVGFAATGTANSRKSGRNKSFSQCEHPVRNLMCYNVSAVPRPTTRGGQRLLGVMPASFQVKTLQKDHRHR